MALLLYMSYGAFQFGTYYEMKKLYGGYVRPCTRARGLHSARLTVAIMATAAARHTVAPPTVDDWLALVPVWRRRRRCRDHRDLPVRPASNPLCRAT